MSIDWKQCVWCIWTAEHIPKAIKANTGFFYFLFVDTTGDCIEEKNVVKKVGTSEVTTFFNDVVFFYTVTCPCVDTMLRSGDGKSRIKIFKTQSKVIKVIRNVFIIQDLI